MFRQASPNGTVSFEERSPLPPARTTVRRPPAGGRSRDRSYLIQPETLPLVADLGPGLPADRHVAPRACSSYRLQRAAVALSGELTPEPEQFGARSSYPVESAPQGKVPKRRSTTSEEAELVCAGSVKRRRRTAALLGEEILLASGKPVVRGNWALQPRWRHQYEEFGWWALFRSALTSPANR